MPNIEHPKFYRPEQEAPYHVEIGVEGNLGKILTKLHDKRDGNTDIRSAFVFGEGGLGGVFQAAVTRSFDETGFDPSVVDISIGSSAGAFTQLFYVTGNSLVGGRVYRELADKKVTDYRRVLQGTALHIPRLRDILTAALPEDLPAELSKIDTELWVTQTLEDGTGVYRKINDETDPLMHTLASGNMPLMSRERIIFDNRRVFDGALHHPTPIEKAVERGANTIICLLTRHPDEDVISDMDLKRINSVPNVLVNRGLKDQIFQLNKKHRDATQFVRGSIADDETDIDIVLLYPENMPIGPFETNGEKMTKVYNAFLKQSKDLLHPFARYPQSVISSHKGYDLDRNMTRQQ